MFLTSLSDKHLKKYVEIVKQTSLSDRRSCYICKSNVFLQKFSIQLILSENSPNEKLVILV